MDNPRTKTADLFRWLFVGTALFHLWAVWREDLSLIYLSKPLLLTFLSLFFYFSVRPLSQPFSRFLLLGLLFSIGGDTLLMFYHGPEDQQFFLLGLSSFLLTHVFYTAAFVRLHKEGIVYRRPWKAWPLLLYWLSIAAVLWPDLTGALRWPVLLYSAVITAMAVSCLNLRDYLSTELFRALFLGVFLFLISDTVIAFSEFKSGQFAIPYPRLIIMSTYLLGQYLIADSAVRIDVEDKSQKSN